MTIGRLDLAQRRRALDELRHGQVDILVVGGGVVGAGAALDAASRGLTTGLVEQGDWASGTSSRSSRLAHGGLRYLEQREFGLVHEALGERGLLLDRLAPHLVRPVRFVFPLTKSWERPYVGAGVALYDVLARFGAGAGSLPGHRHLTRRAALRLIPALDPDSLSGAIAFFDAQIDDARHTLAAVRTAVAHGALAASRVEVTGFLRDGEQVVGVTATDRLNGELLRLRARVVVTATGVWSTAALLDGTAEPSPVTPSKGVHLVVPRHAVVAHSALIARTPTSVLFLLPWGEHWLVGTTDTPWSGVLGHDQDTLTASDDDIDYLLTEANRWLRRPLQRSDVVGVYVGLRPLVADDQVDDTTKVSREHVVTRPAPGLVGVAGGKYTTYRVMAADAVDAAVEQLPEELRAGPSRTAGVALVGGEHFQALWDERAGLAVEADLPVHTVEHLLRRHGDQASDVLDLLRDDESHRRRVAVGEPYLRGEIVYAATTEGALDIADVMHRRTRLGQESLDAGAAHADTVATLLATALGWSAAEATERARAYRARPRAWTPSAED